MAEPVKLKVAVVPWQTVWLGGWPVMSGFAVTVNVAELEVTGQEPAPVTTTSYWVPLASDPAVV